MFSFSKGRQKRCRIAIVLLEEKMKQTSFKGKTTKTLQQWGMETTQTKQTTDNQLNGLLSCLYALYV